MIDRVISINENTLLGIPGAKGGMELIDESFYLKAIQQFPQAILSLGGSALNVCKVLASLKSPTLFTGTVGNDADGDWIKEKIDKYSIDFQSQTSTLRTGGCLSFVTPDSKRTLRTFLGASQQIGLNPFQDDLLEPILLTHFEGYLMDREDFLEEAILLAKKHRSMISLDVGSFEFASRFKNRFLNILPNIDILFCNDEEALFLTGLPPGQACQVLSHKSEIAVVTCGLLGGYVGKDGQIIHYSAIPAKSVDTTGAGDYFAGAFLFAYLKHKALQECANFAALVASEIVKVQGTELDPNIWSNLKTHLNEK